ncbi:GNAT family N-acetyltransferase [Spongiactinospora rosea]|uniref:GNAT family N-acetyltransferase n=1 Tax=Spongiactinospora rosea TaxID=2248750 RepID=A0A366LJ29_9ACTN|nr:GNAT family N-acetyltransferase [Spongiactinospora rosea]RBQ13897.1 GNAT family N-acetyltransferase [Spongiactinospora rosea]
MLTHDVVYHLEMTSLAELRPARPSRAAVRLREIGLADVRDFREIHDRVGGPHGWPSLTWPESRWREHLARPGVRAWIAEVDGRPAGFAQLQAQPGHTVEIEYFGLAPEYVGHGIGGHLLTLITRLAWEPAPGGEESGVESGEEIRRVRVRTSRSDHPHARANYQARGFRLTREEPWEREFGIAAPH